MTESDELRSGVEVRCFVLLNNTGDRTPFYLLPGLNVEISASQIRNLTRDLASDAGSSAAADALLPSAVFDYIRSRGLYR